MQNFVENTDPNKAKELHTMKDSQDIGILSRRGNMNKSLDCNNDSSAQWQDKLKSSRQDNRHATGVEEQKTLQNLPEMVEPTNSQCRDRPSFDLYQQYRRAPQEASYNIPTPPPTPQKSQTMISSVLDISKIGCDGGGKTEGGYLSRQSTRNKASFPSPISIVVDDSEENGTETESPTKFDRSLSDLHKNDIIQSLNEMNEEHREYCFRVLESAMKNRAGSRIDISTVYTTSSQDSPRPNLKRQLSRDSFDERGNFRAYKRVSTRGNDEESSDGDLSSCNEIGINQTVCFSQSTDDSKSHSDKVANIPISVSTNHERGIQMLESDLVPEERFSAWRVSVDQVGNAKCLYDQHIPESPGTQHFNLKDIALTSPFLPQSGRQDGNGNVFIFPDVTSAKESDSSNDQRFSEETCKTKENGIYWKDIKGKANDFPNRDLMRAEGSDSVLQYVPKTGFVWPDSADNTQPILFSPRIVPGHAQPRFPKLSKTETSNSNSLLKLSTSTTSNLSKTGDFPAMIRRDPDEDEFIRKNNDLYTRSAMGNDNPQLSPSSKEINDILRRSWTKRSISDIERSPSEKEIREMRRETDRKYDRSWSDPTFDPRQQRVGGIAQNRHPFNMDSNDELFCNTGEEEYAAKRMGNVLMRSIHERRRDPWPSEVRRKLFSTVPEELYSRNTGTSYEDKDPLSGSLGIPDDVARFFHSRNFHPEDLQNLREIFQRSKPIPNDHFNRIVFLNEDGGYHPPDMGKRFDSFRAKSPYHYQEFDEEDHGRMFSASHAGIRPYREDRGPHSPVKNHTPSWVWGSTRHRSRRRGDIDVRLTCESVAEKTRQINEILKELQHDDKKCDCSKVEEEILTMARDAFAKVRRQDDSKPSFQQFSKELQETNATVYQSLKILAGMKSLCKYGRSLEDILSGSVIFRLNCPTLDALEDLWATYCSGALLKDLEEAFVTDDLKEKFSADSIKLMTSISEDDYTKCKYDLGHTESKRSNEGDTDVKELALSTPKKPSAEKQSLHLNVVHVRSRSAPVTGSQPSTPSDVLSPLSRERKFSDSSIEQSPRRAFQEINVGKDVPCSPTKKSFLDNVFWTDEKSKSPKASPKRKTFGFRPPWEHENFHPELESPLKSPRW